MTIAAIWKLGINCLYIIMIICIQSIFGKGLYLERVKLLKVLHFVKVRAMAYIIYSSKSIIEMSLIIINKEFERY